MVIHTFIAHMGIGGAERVCVTLANEWADRGHEVHIVVLNLDNDINTKDLRASVQVHELGVSRLRYAAFPMLMYIYKHKPPFLFIFGKEMAVILNKLRKLRLQKTPLVVRVLNNVNITLAKEDNVSQTVENYLNRANRELADMEHIIAQCEGMGKQLLDEKIVAAEKLTVVYNPVSEDLINRVKEVRAGNLVTDRPYEITFIGRIDPQKNPEHLIKAFNIVHESKPEVRLRMVGEGNLSEMARELVRSLNLSDAVIFDGIRSDMENVYAGSDVVVLSSEYEGMPNCLIEAIGCGIPVVSYDCPLGPSEIVEDGVNGYLVPLHDYEALAGRLTDALTRDWNREEIVATCDKFRVKRAASRLEEVFDGLD